MDGTGGLPTGVGTGLALGSKGTSGGTGLMSLIRRWVTWMMSVISLSCFTRSRRAILCARQSPRRQLSAWCVRSSWSGVAFVLARISLMRQSTMDSCKVIQLDSVRKSMLTDGCFMREIGISVGLVRGSMLDPGWQPGCLAGVYGIGSL